ncbi:hypothetical protein [Nocardia donostiensis]|uniref:PPM-type phosphatase domain-containing protein n=1 Tax=Nocardia donostiensis TaxID=1538463 RepID=A0A1W0AU92_9NOCA|nr:hypothetical protein [Nocardia donostiensis]ONM48197.1 hypothetical protein B0T46_14565 [Nocardia donostiensis]OQS13812.1 hypothetical protein B0T36_16820 [Nocardia donostiensis]OQS17687.1 hypothetical protein B0T44_23475 [Nocardia donostiensis]
MDVTSGSIGKDGRDADENADRVGTGVSRFALADGASDASYPGIWAELLVWSFLQGRNPFQPSTLSHLRWRWNAKTRPAAHGSPWYVVRKQAQGSAAAFVGLILDTENHRFTVSALGDSCLLHLRDRAVVNAGPLDSSSQFTRTPALLTTHTGDEDCRTRPWQLTERYLPGDSFVLASDALAKYLLHRREQGLSLDLAELGDGGPHFKAWVTEARAERALDNDDTTFCLVRP